jgi:hypothetical protein
MTFKQLPKVRGVAQTRVTYIQHVNLNGGIPGFVVNSQGVGFLM